VGIRSSPDGEAEADGLDGGVVGEPERTKIENMISAAAVTTCAERDMPWMTEPRASPGVSPASLWFSLIRGETKTS
jgi:hypothetical protein